MDVHKILDELYAERARIENAILALEVLREGQSKRRGRPPKWLVEARRRSRALLNHNAAADHPDPS